MVRASRACARFPVTVERCTAALEQAGGAPWSSRSGSRPRSPARCSREWIARKEAVVARAKTLVVPIFVERATGATLTDVDGNTFLDFAGGIGCLDRRALQRRASRGACTSRSTASCTPTSRSCPTTPTSSSPSGSPPRVPISGPVKAAFFNSGAEAVENAVKIARSATGRPAVIAFTNAFHGRTLMAIIADLEDPPVQGRLRALRARGLPRALPRRVPLGAETTRPSEALDQLRLAFRTTRRSRRRSPAS